MLEWLEVRLDPCAAAASRRAEILCHAPRHRRIFLWLSQIPAENGNFIRQSNIFRRIFGAHINRINYVISKSKQC